MSRRHWILTPCHKLSQTQVGNLRHENREDSILIHCTCSSPISKTLVNNCEQNAHSQLVGGREQFFFAVIALEITIETLKLLLLPAAIRAKSR